MKKTLALCLLCGMSALVWAQTPTIIQKVTAPVKNASAEKAAQVNAALGSSAPTNVRVVAVPAAQSKPSAVVAKPAQKPAVVVVHPAPKPVIAVTPAKGPAPSKPVAVAATPAKSAAPQVHGAPAVQQAHAAKVMAPVKPVAAEVPGNKGPFSKKSPQATVKAPPSAAQAKAGTVVAVNESKPAADQKKVEPKKISVTARRDPFVSPVVHLGSLGSGCSSGKRCLAIDQIALKGVVRSETGMIAVVVNAMDKAYFLRENDPVFNGYVTKITQDSIMFKETFHDKLGKELTRDVTKSISRPAA